MLLFAGYFTGKLAEKIKLPSITGYIIAGIVLSQSMLGMIHQEIAHQLTSVTEIALGIIALTIGGEFYHQKLRKIGSTIFIMIFFEVIGAFVFVTTILYFIGLDIRYALILGAISTATAPATTVIIIRELRARGNFIDYLYGIVAFDDALCVIIFSIVFALVTPLLAGVGIHSESSVIMGFFHALKELLLSCLLGLTGGISLHFLTRKKYKTNEILIISLAIIFLTTSIAIVLNLSLLMANMFLGAILVNLSLKNKRIFQIIEPITPPVFALFFILAGTELDINVFSKGIVIVYGIVYIFARFAGKYLGIYFSSVLTSAPSNIRKFLGLCLFPQAGVAIGLALFVQTSPVMNSAPAAVSEVLVLLVNIVLFSIFINELIGPAISKFGIIKGAEL
ncbi:cation:proton antiporter [Candidatus Latescibacterota bacterium]